MICPKIILLAHIVKKLELVLETKNDFLKYGMRFSWFNQEYRGLTDLLPFWRFIDLQILNNCPFPWDSCPLAMPWSSLCPSCNCYHSISKLGKYFGLEHCLNTRQPATITHYTYSEHYKCYVRNICITSFSGILVN